MNQTSPPYPDNLAVPVETLLVDRSGLVRFAAGNIFTNLPHLGTPWAPGEEMALTAILDSLLSPADCRELAGLLDKPAAAQFTRRYDSGASPNRTFTVSGSLFAHDPERQWLLTFQDVSACLTTDRRLVVLERELEAVLLFQAEELEEATASLIETNVALRKEIRDRQAVLEALSESEERFRNLTETTSDFIWQIDAEGRYTYASPKSRQLLGLEPQQIVGTLFFPWRQASAGQARPEIPRHSFSHEYSYLRQDGREVIVESNGEPIHSRRGEIVGYRGIDRDVTAQRVYEIELKRAKELAEAANRAKSEFLANMSHELRTPLHAILSFANFGERKIDNADRSELLRFFQQISTSGNRLIPLINSLLDLAQLEAGRMKYNPGQHDLIAEIELAFSELRPLAEQKGLTLAMVPPGIPAVAFFDQGRIGQVIRNILSNAIQFSDPDTTIEVALTRLEESADRKLLRTTISNHGIEIPEVERTIIFDAFSQSSKTKNGAGGTGLGLAICRQIVTDHRGRIWVDSKEGATRFHFTLPLKPRPEQPGPASR